MIHRTLTFEQSATDKIRFRLLWDALLSGSQVERTKLQRDQKQQSREDRRAERRLKEALVSISVPIEGEALERWIKNGGVLPTSDDEIDRRPRQLNGGGEITFEQPDYSRLQRYVEQTPWLVDVVEHVADLEDWLEATPKRDSKKQKDEEESK